MTKRQNITERERSEEALRKARDELEIRFEERTAELTAEIEALRESEQHFRTIFEDGPFGMALVSPDFSVVSANARLCEMLGYSEAELQQLSFPEITHPDDIDENVSLAKRVFRDEISSFQLEKRYIRKNGEALPTNLTATVIRNRDGEPIYGLAMIEDITERKRAEKALQESEARLKAIVDNSPNLIYLKDIDGRYIFINAHAKKIMGQPGQGLIGKTTFDWAPKELAKALAENDREVIQTGSVVIREEQLLSADGGVQTHIATKFPIRDGSGNIVGLGGINTDITERKKTEQMLRESEALFRSVITHSPSAIHLKDKDGRMLLVNKQFENWFGLAEEEVVGKTARDMYQKEYAEEYAAHDKEVIETGEVIERDREIPIADGSIHSFAVIKFPVKGPDGDVSAVGTISIDITERNRMEDALRQSQKMEAIGQLTGGVAHEFNNLLMVIVGNLEYAKEKIEDGQEVDRYVERALAAADRGAALTQRLLAFSRKQSLRPRPIDLNEMKPGLIHLLRPALGETIEVDSVFAPDLWLALVDLEQIETTIFTLAINARDAMPDGGRLTIEAANVRLGNDDLAEDAELEPGDYVLLSVTDTGDGMPPKVLEHAFEPFYTTKEVGKGTGLGLSMVHGFVKQSGGHVEIASEVGSGTTVKIYLPRSTETSAQSDGELVVEPEYRGKGETILVVEDEPAVRELFVHMLTDLGYEIVEAGDGKAALQVLNETPGISLLFTDVVLPKGMSGGKLAREAQQRRPDLKVLYTSGYADDSIAQHWQLDEDAELVRKPYRKATLARKVREALDSGK